VSTAQASDVASRFLDALARHDFDGIGESFAEDGRLRGLVPTALRELEGREAIAERFEMWTGDGEVVESGYEDFADVVKLRWRVVETDEEGSPVVFEQTAYAEIGDEGIAWMNLVCSGQRPTG
jgi:ketosteroid isomerase-like protein